MKNKSNDNKNNQANDELSDVSQASDAAYEVEEQVFVRQQYENTSSFEMDIEKAKAMAASSQHTDQGSHEPPADLVGGSDETDAIKRSLAELREREQMVGSDDGYDDEPGLLQRIKNLFIR